MDRAFVLSHLDRVVRDGAIPGLPGHHRGKVRDAYVLADGRRLLIATDRLSAFDRALCAVPFKGQVLTALARFWFEATADICANHVIGVPDANVTLCRDLTMLPIEMVVRGHLAGTTGTSILTLYRAGAREMYGVRLPDGLADNAALPTPILTPTTKGSATGRDEPLSPADIVALGLISPERWDEVSAAALALFARGREVAARHGLILADTKYEFGIDEDGRLVLADEIHTPDSSRFWEAIDHAERVAAGQPPASLDKDVVRRWVTERCDPYSDAIPAIPDELIVDTALAYVAAYERLTGTPFVPDVSGEAPAARIRANVLALLG